MPVNLRTNINRLNPNRFDLVFRIVFYLALGYVWLEFSNPRIGYDLQIVRRIPNGAVAVIICWIFRPDEIRRIKVPVQFVRWALPLLIIATVNLFFVEYAFRRTLIDLIASWYWVVFLTPIMVRVLSTSFGRLHYTLFTLFGVILLSGAFFHEINSKVSSRAMLVDHAILGPELVLIMPIVLGYLFNFKDKRRYIFFLAFIFLLIVGVLHGSRAGWAILLLELFLMVFFVLPKMKIMRLGLVTLAFFYTLSGFVNDYSFLGTHEIEHLQSKWWRVKTWREDITIKMRAAAFTKTLGIIKEYPLLGVGFSNRSYTDYNFSDDYLFVTEEGKGRDPHDTYLNILAGTGILGFAALLYFLKKVYTLFRYIPRNLKVDPHIASFFVSALGMMVDYFSRSQPFSEVVMTLAIIPAIYVMYYNSPKAVP